MRDTLVIGLGGAGIGVCRRLAERAAAHAGAPPELLLLDTDAASLAEGGNCVHLTASAAMLDAAYRAPERFHAEWCAPEVLRERGALTAGAQGSRMLGRFLLLLPDNLAAVREKLTAWLSRAAEPGRVFVVAGGAGGTGGGGVADLGYLIADCAAAAARPVDARAILLVPPPHDEGAPNALATLTELHYFADPDTRHSAHLGPDAAPRVSRDRPYHRVALLTSLTPDGEPIALTELQERAAVYLFTASLGDAGLWETERAERERTVAPTDADGNPQGFATFGVEWVEYPEERLVRAVYRNLLRRSLIGWLHGDRPAQLSEVPAKVLLRDSASLVEQLTGAGAEAGVPEELTRGLQARLPWLHKAPPHQWAAVDKELETGVIEAIGVPPTDGRRAKGPIAERCRPIREAAVGELRRAAGEWLKRDGVNLDRTARVLTEAATEIGTVTDPVARWEAARDATREQRRHLLWCQTAVRTDPFLLFGRRTALRKLAAEYQRVCHQYILVALQAAAVPFMRELRQQVQEPARTWAQRVRDLSGLLLEGSKAWANEESAYLERLRKDEEDGRLALGLLTLPGRETPYVANTGWNLPYAGAEEEGAAITTLRTGWYRHLVEPENGLLAGPGRSALEGPGGLSSAVERADRALRGALEERLRSWLSATVFHRLAEQHRDPVELEFHLRRMVGNAAELPALEPPHARPDGFPAEYEVIFFEGAKAEELPGPLRLVAEHAARERPTRILPSRSSHYLTAVTEHAGFSLARCPAYFQLTDHVHDRTGGAPLPFSRTDVPWLSAGLVTRERRGDAADVLFLALAFGILRATPEGAIPLPASLVPASASERRFALPAEFDLAVRQLAGDPAALEGVALAVDRAVQAKGVEWCNLQIERAVTGENPLRVTFPPAAGWVNERETEDAARARRVRLAALRASARFADLQDELGRGALGAETDWLRVGDTHVCPGCGHDLGADAAAVPGACPACRGPLVLAKLVSAAPADGFRRIPNPYVVGTPLETGASVFVGREDIVTQVRERLIRPAQRTILILIGERRCGKTSALKQLQYRIEGDLTPLFVDMQGLTATDLPGFLWWLAWRMKEALDERGIQVDLPSFEQFSSGPPDFQFETIILPEIRKKLAGGRILLMLDEFEVLAQRVMKGTFDGRAFDYLRHLMQHSEGIEFLFAGTHILRQFAANYVTFLFNIGVFLDVDFLQPKDALRLIQEPVAPSGVTYSEEALDSVLELAGAHPYFTQMFGFHLVERLNRLRKRSIGREDVEAESGPVIAAAGAHLDHLWGQLADVEKLLIAFFAECCPRGETRTEDEVLQAAIREDAALRPYLFRTAAEKLITVGLLRPHEAADPEGRPIRAFSLTAEVYRQWLQTAHPYRRLREEGLLWQ
jgi:rubrerythrin